MTKWLRAHAAFIEESHPTAVILASENLTSTSDLHRQM